MILALGLLCMEKKTQFPPLLLHVLASVGQRVSILSSGPITVLAPGPTSHRGS